MLPPDAERASDREGARFVLVPGEDAREYGSHLARSRSWVVRVGALDEVHPDAPRMLLDDDGPPILSIRVSGPLDARSAS